MWLLLYIKCIMRADGRERARWGEGWGGDVRTKENLQESKVC